MGSFQAGAVFGHYRIQRLLGRGGMAEVYLVEQADHAEPLALKLLPAELAGDAERVARFEREIRAAAALRHPHVVAVHEVGEQDGLLYFTMEWLPGGDLRRRLRQGALTPAEAAAIVHDIALALDHAHRHGLVHRDVKPENILFREDGSTVLADFGIVRSLDTATRVTGTGVSIGTPCYMSPEQLQGRRVDGRADLYALGVVLHEMLAGSPPFEGEDDVALAYQHVHAVPPALPAAAASLQPVVDRLLAKRPARRYRDGRAVAADLARWIAAGGGQGAGLAGIRPHAGRARRRIPAWGWGLAGAASALLLALGLQLWREARSPVLPVGGGQAPAAGVAMPQQPGPRATEDDDLLPWVRAEAASAAGLDGQLGPDASPDHADAAVRGPMEAGAAGTGVEMRVAALAADAGFRARLRALPEMFDAAVAAVEPLLPTLEVKRGMLDRAGTSPAGRRMLAQARLDTLAAEVVDLARRAAALVVDLRHLPGDLRALDAALSRYQSAPGIKALDSLLPAASRVARNGRRALTGLLGTATLMAAAASRLDRLAAAAREHALGQSIATAAQRLSMDLAGGRGALEQLGASFGEDVAALELLVAEAQAAGIWQGAAASSTQAW